MSTSSCSIVNYQTVRWLIILAITALLFQYYVRNSMWSYERNPVARSVVCSEPLILLDDGGRMGNQFFEYLEAKLLAEQLNRIVFIRRSLSGKFKSYFTGIENPVFESFQEVNQLCNNTNNRVKIHMSGLVKINPASISKPHVLLTTGYPDFIPPELWATLLARRDELLGDFQWRPELKEAVREYVEQLTLNQTYSKLIGVHVRMQDYHAHMNAYYGPSKIPGRQYFNDSMNYYRQKFGEPLFLVVSNDMAWCRETLQDDDIVFGGSGNETDPGWDLALLTSCDHLIMTYGSFGVMAAYMMGGEVVAADNFSTKPNTFSENIRRANWSNWHWIGVD